MSLLKNIISGAVSQGIEKAVGKAVEKAVTPAAEKFAQKQADAIDKAAIRMENAVESTSKTISDAAEAAEEASSKPLTEEEKAQAKEAAEALRGLGTMFTGAVAMAKKEMEEEKKKKEEEEKAIFDNWSLTLGDYPVWDVGGRDFSLDGNGFCNGHPAYLLHIAGQPYLLEQYIAKLKAAGFQRKHMGSDEVLYKMSGGLCRAFGTADACYGGGITVSYYVDDYDPEKAAREAQKKAASELKGVAKGILKKLF